MTTTRRDFLKLLGGAVVGTTASDALLGTLRAYAGSADLPVSADPALHFLNRISYGVLPEDLAHLREIGLAAYLEAQLAPEMLADPAGDEVLADLPILLLDRNAVHSIGFDGRVHRSITEGMVWRAVRSSRQLHERMVEFWTDHFNIPASDLAHDVLIMHREVIRRHALGSFRDLALGVAQSPAMLYYLDQAYSTQEHPNENYARELLELHTLGVDGGYTEQDVQEAARALTGWTVFDGTETGFYFDPSTHDSEAKVILGHEMPAGRGIEDGLHLISILTNHPANARFICHKLCVRFVSDDPPEPLVESAAQVWQAHDGALVPVLRHIFTSNEFNQSAGLKLRRPLDFFIGALRVTQTRFQEDWLAEVMLQDLSQLPYGWNPPDGYPDTAEAWISSAGLLARWNTAMALSHVAYSEEDAGMTTRLDTLIGSPSTAGELVNAVAQRTFGTADLPADVLTAFVDYASDGEGADAALTPGRLASKLGSLFGLMLASPLYQWRWPRPPSRRG
ncbi:MAG TPA: DUF1800 domain-containing protein, partial [Candidatus Limnocylindrales bacterium]|nr:DUF1800 domain-containing protein [Candidatus Limnocylindrales bacterium]